MCRCDFTFAIFYYIHYFGTDYNHKKCMAAVLSAIILAIIAVIVLCLMHQNRGQQLDFSTKEVLIRETGWVYNGTEKNEITEEINCGVVQKGDVLYEKNGYRLTVHEIYSDRIIVSQDGGLVMANDDGSLNALDDAKKTYTVKIGKCVKLRSYSLQMGVLLEIVL